MERIINEIKQNKEWEKMRNKIMISNYGNLLSKVIIWILLRIIIDFLCYHLSIIKQ